MTTKWHLSDACGDGGGAIIDILGDWPEHPYRSAKTYDWSGAGPYDRLKITGASTTRLYRLRNVFVGRRGVVFDQAGRIFTPHVAPFHHQIAVNPRKFRYVMDPLGFKPGETPQTFSAPFDPESVPVSQEIKGPVFLASSYWEQAYTHFIIELLGSILTWKFKLDAAIPLLLNADVQRSRKGLLEACQVDDKRVMTKHENDVVFVNELLVSTYPRFAAPEMAALLRQGFGHNFDPVLRDSGPAVYLARHDAYAWDRNILNEGPLIDKMKREGFEICVPSELSFQEQLETLWKARLIVGQYGGAMFTSLLGMTGKRSLVLCSEDYNRFDYDGLADCLGHSPVKLLCRSFTSRRDPNNSPFFVNLDAFWELKEKMLG